MAEQSRDYSNERLALAMTVINIDNYAEGHRGKWPIEVLMDFLSSLARSIINLRTAGASIETTERVIVANGFKNRQGLGPILPWGKKK